MNGHVLLVTIGYSPNVGGIETHFDDLTKGLLKRKWRVTVLTYQPLTTNKVVSYIEHHKNLEIYRLPILRGLFYSFVKSPMLEFLYLVPGLFIALPILLLKESDITVIHSHGLVAGFISVFWGMIFRKRVVTTTHSIYDFPKSGLYRTFSKFIFSNSKEVLCLSDKSVDEIKRLGVDSKKIKRFVYWIDSQRFTRVKGAKKALHIKGKFVVLFVGRLVEEKGITVLLDSLRLWPDGAHLLVAGIGPMENIVKEFQSKYPEKLTYLGKILQNDLPLYYSAVDTLIVPSVSEEGFGRVIIESLACGTPIIGSNRGAIPEAIDNSVGILIDVSARNISNAVRDLSINKKHLQKMKNNARRFAMKRYSEENIHAIVETY